MVMRAQIGDAPALVKFNGTEMELGLILLAAAVVLAALVLAFTLRRPAAAEADPRLDTLLASQGEIKGQFQNTVAAQAELQRTLSERIDALNARMGASLSESATQTAATVAGIAERLSIIDAAQKNITALSGQVVALQDILSDKQARGAWGEERMQDIVIDQLPPEFCSFPGKLSNNSEPDCVIRVPGMKEAIVIDAKFPLEAYEALKQAADDGARKSALSQMRTDIQKHVGDIARKYVIPGEVQTPVIMFVPSESVYSEIHHALPDVLLRARRAQIVVVSPHILWLAVNTIRTVMRDARMREQAHEIQKEVGALLKDVKLLAERMGDLRTHFERTSKDLGEIEKPLGRIVFRAGRIEAVELAPAEAAPPLAKPS